MAPFPALHIVTSDSVVAREDFIATAGALMRATGARAALHLRAPRLAGNALREIAALLAPLQEESGSWLVVTERVDIALATGAYAVQLTSHSMRVSDARQIATSLRIGASVHAVGEGRAAVDAGADWIVASHVLDAPRAETIDGRGLVYAAALVDACAVPIVAIGGIQPGHVSLLRRIGVAGVAVIRGVWDAPDAVGAAAHYLSAYDAARGA